MHDLYPFHVAVPVQDLDVASDFYVGTLGCVAGHRARQWIDFNFYGHQIVAHLAPVSAGPAPGKDGGKPMPLPHFGVILPMDQWQQLADRLQDLNLRFEAEPTVRFKGEEREQGAMLFYDPYGNAIEIKGFVNMAQLFPPKRAEIVQPSSR